MATYFEITNRTPRPLFYVRGDILTVCDPHTGGEVRYRIAADQSLITVYDNTALAAGLKEVLQAIRLIRGKVGA